MYNSGFIILGESRDPLFLQCTTRAVYRSNAINYNARGKFVTLLFYSVPLLQYTAPILNFTIPGRKYIIGTFLYYNVPFVQHTAGILEMIMLGGD